MTHWLYLESYLFEEKEPHRAYQTQKVPVAIQTGSFLVKENAEYMITDLEAVGFSAQIEETEREGRVYFRIIIKGMQTVEEAQEKLRKLKASAFDGFLIISY